MLLGILGLAWLSRTTMMKARGKLMQAGKSGKALMGLVMVAIAALILTGADKPFETWLLNASPIWLSNLTTRF